MKDLFFIKKVHYEDKHTLIEKVTSRYNLTPTYKPDSWEENVHTTINYETSLSVYDYCLKSNIPVSLLELLDLEVQLYVKKIGLEGVGKFSICEIWYNAYKNRQYQHMHKHGNQYNIFFSGVYYVNYDPLHHTATRFYHPGFEIDFDQVRDHPYFVYTPAVKEDDLIIFPSQIGHDVPIQDCSNLRITVSFNVKCEYYEHEQFTYS